MKELPLSRRLKFSHLVMSGGAAIRAAWPAGWMAGWLAGGRATRTSATCEGRRVLYFSPSSGLISRLAGGPEIIDDEAARAANHPVPLHPSPSLHDMNSPANSCFQKEKFIIADRRSIGLAAFLSGRGF